MEKQYKLKNKYPSLSSVFENGDIIQYNSNLKIYVRVKPPYRTVDINEVENHPDYWELIEEKKLLFITDDGVVVFDDNVFVFIVSIKSLIKIRWFASTYKNYKDKNNIKVFYHESNADKYIEENKLKPLLITEDGVEVSDKSKNVISIDAFFNKCTFPAQMFINENREHGQFKAFYHESNADEYIWQNKRVFSYKDMMKAKHSILITNEDIEKSAKERSEK